MGMNAFLPLVIALATFSRPEAPRPIVLESTLAHEMHIAAGDTVQLGIYRDGKQTTVTVTLAAR